MTLWPTRFDCHVWATPMACVTTGIATMPATSRASRWVSIAAPRFRTLFSRSRSRKGGTTPSAAEKRIIESSHESRSR